MNNKAITLFALLVVLSAADNLCPAYQCLSRMPNKYREAPDSFNYCAYKLDALRQDPSNSVDSYSFFNMMACPSNNGEKAYCDTASVNALH